MSDVPVASTPVHRRRPLNRWLLVGAAVVLILTAVSAAGLLIAQPGSPASAAGPASRPFVGAADPGPLRLNVTPSDGRKGVRLNAKVRVRADAGTLRSVKVSSRGRTLDGTFDLRAHTWTAAGGLAPGARYTVSVVAVDTAGNQIRKTTGFTTMRPERELRTSIMPLDGETVGVGMPIAVFFNEPVKDRAEVERRLVVETASDVEGAWHWFNDEEVRWRPRKYWPAGEKVTLRIGLTGVEAGDGVWGVADRVIRFKIGDTHISRVNVDTHRMVVTENGRTVRTMPASTGRDRYPTTNGIHTVLGKEVSRIMDSATVPGIPAGESYRLRVAWATRISNSGEFVHAAPWSVGAQGRANVSHGCVNLSTAHAAWFYRFSLRGDIVQVIGSPRQPGEIEGLREWNRSWKEWAAGSALR
jgi:lipoprotein-anchoring transpeptidase ErfK/SrfK